jgi:hypothetical protein
MGARESKIRDDAGILSQSLLKGLARPLHLCVQ